MCWLRVRQPVAPLPRALPSCSAGPGARALHDCIGTGEGNDPDTGEPVPAEYEKLWPNLISEHVYDEMIKWIQISVRSLLCVPM